MQVGSWLREQGLSGGELRKLVERGGVRLHGVPTSDLARELHDPKMISILKDGPKLQPGRDLVILRRAPGLVVVWKPSGLLSVPAPGRREPSVLGRVRALFGEALPVHRLDQATTGVMMVALDERTQTAIKDMLERHEIQREYLAIVAGVFPVERWTAESELVRDRGDGLRGSAFLPESPIARRAPREVTPKSRTGARRAVTHLERIAAPAAQNSLLLARLETGRTHQVRIHLSELGTPILGDTLYAPHGVARQGPRLALHARALALKHPFTGEEIRVETCLPDDLEYLRRALWEGKRPR